MIVITTDHTAHDPDRFTEPSDPRRYWEVPARIEALLGALRSGGLTTRPATDHGLAPIERIHDKDYLAFLQSAFTRYQELPAAGPVLRAQAYAVRHPARRPEVLMGQAGYYLSSLSAPIVAATCLDGSVWVPEIVAPMASRICRLASCTISAGRSAKRSREMKLASVCVLFMARVQ